MDPNQIMTRIGQAGTVLNGVERTINGIKETGRSVIQGKPLQALNNTLNTVSSAASTYYTAKGLNPLGIG